jgi:uncharacterized membrane protein YfcA
VPDLDAAQWVAVVTALLLVGAAKTSFSGLGVVAVALFALALPARASTGALLPVLLVGDVLAVAFYRRHAEWPRLLRLLPWVALGVVLGALLVGRVDDGQMRRLIGVSLLVVLAASVLRGRLERRARQPAAPVSADPLAATDAGLDASPRSEAALLVPLVGVLAGALTMLANAAGPLMAVYLLSAGLPVMAFLGTSAWFFLVVNAFKVPFSVGLGLLTPATALLALASAPGVLAGGLLGRAVAGRVSQRVFERATLVLTLVAAVRLLL